MMLEKIKTISAALLVSKNPERLAFNVDDVEIFAKHIQEYGIKLEYPPLDVGFCLLTAFHDPDENYLEFTKLKKRK